MPTCVRGQGIALVNVMSMISQMASPYIVYSVSTTPGTALALPPTSLLSAAAVGLV